MEVKPLQKSDLPDLVVKALRHSGGGAPLVIVAKYIWDNHREDLEASKDLLYTWQYDMRWAALKLRHRGVMKSTDESLKGVWELR